MENNDNSCKKSSQIFKRFCKIDIWNKRLKLHRGSTLVKNRRKENKKASRNKNKIGQIKRIKNSSHLTYFIYYSLRNLVLKSSMHPTFVYIH